MKCKKCGRDFKMNECGIECPFCFSVYTFTKEELDRIFYDNIPQFVDFLKDETVTRDYILYKIRKYREGHIV